MGILSGYRVLDCSIAMAGPFAAQRLGDLGADVVKVEPTTGEWQRHVAAGGAGPLLELVDRHRIGHRWGMGGGQGRHRGGLEPAADHGGSSLGAGGLEHEQPDDHGQPALEHAPGQQLVQPHQGQGHPHLGRLLAHEGGVDPKPPLALEGEGLLVKKPGPAHGPVEPQGFFLR